MIIEWNTDLYRNIRKNFTKHHDVFTGVIPEKNLEQLFREELEQCCAKVEQITPHWAATYVTDSLGMSSYHRVIFTDDKNYIWFVLRWT